MTEVPTLEEVQAASDRIATEFDEADQRIKQHPSDFTESGIR